MDVEILSRALWALAIAITGVAAYGLTNRVILARAANKSPGLDGFAPGIPAILYFTTPTCAPCKTVQRPAIQQVQQTLGNRVQIIEVDASDRIDLAQKWGVMSVPTTFILDKNGQPRRINHGIARADKLLEQLKN
jgi:thiol-disulfide isomerase/thioredoxin